MIITASISPRMSEKPTNKQAAPNIMQRQVANSSHPSFILAISMLEPEKQITIEFESKTSQRVRF